MSLRAGLILRGTVPATLFLASYLAIVILTSPSVPPLYAVMVALNTNALLLLILLLSIFIQGYIGARLSILRGCRVRRKTVGSLTAGGVSLSSIVSFLSLIHLGCCSMWLYILSLIAGTGGAGLAFVTALIQSPTYVMITGLVTVWAGNIYMITKYLTSVKSFPADRQQ